MRHDDKARGNLVCIQDFLERTTQDIEKPDFYFLQKLCKEIKQKQTSLHKPIILQGLNAPLIHATIDDILQKSPYKQPELAFAAILAFMGAMFGRRFAADIYDTRTNIYVMGFAESGRGKSFARKYMLNLFNKIGLGCFVGSQSIRSAEGLTQEVLEKPSQVMCLDEWGM